MSFSPLRGSRIRGKRLNPAHRGAMEVAISHSVELGITPLAFFSLALKIKWRIFPSSTIYFCAWERETSQVSNIWAQERIAVLPDPGDAAETWNPEQFQRTWIWRCRYQHLFEKMSALGAQKRVVYWVLGSVNLQMHSWCFKTRAGPHVCLTRYQETFPSCSLGRV